MARFPKDDTSFRRPSFLRLQDVLSLIRPYQPTVGPVKCQDPLCQNSLGDHYFRRADGFTVCASCFEHWRTEDETRPARPV